MPVSSKSNSNIVCDGATVKLQSRQWFEQNCTDIYYGPNAMYYRFQNPHFDNASTYVPVGLVDEFEGMLLEVDSTFTDAYGNEVYKLVVAEEEPHPMEDEHTVNSIKTVYFTRDMLVLVKR